MIIGHEGKEFRISSISFNSLGGAKDVIIRRTHIHSYLEMVRLLRIFTSACCPGASVLLQRLHFRQVLCQSLPKDVFLSAGSKKEYLSVKPKLYALL